MSVFGRNTISLACTGFFLGMKMVVSSGVDFKPFRYYNKRSKIKRKVRNWGQLILGTITGILLGLTTESNIFMSGTSHVNMTCTSTFISDDSSVNFQKFVSLKYNEDPFKIINMNDSSYHNSYNHDNLVFVGVMTAQKYLATRAVAVYETWGRELPGRIAFFSSETSSVPKERMDLPLVRLKKVDDSYPPQKKSFMMLQYMWENYGDHFEWFIRADDDVYIRGDKLEKFLRSIDNSKPLFIGQAGRGNQEEFGLLSLEYDENFCMGGPGIIISRETMRRIAPHIRYCLKNLYTTHEDVELGRCVKKFADVSCTWSYEMQTILYHNSSGSEAFTGNLKQKEVNRAITLHPVKQYKHMYRIHNYMRQLKFRELLHDVVLLQRDLKKFRDLTKNTDEALIKEIEKVFNNNTEYKKILQDTDTVGLEPDLKKFKASNDRELLHWDFIQRSLFSADNLNPRRRLEIAYREGIEDVVREFMETINKFSRQRGRVIEYQDLLYGYSRLDPLHGVDYILDLLLKYKKYRGRKMTVPVRRHAYLQRQFSHIEIRESITDAANIDDKQFIRNTFLEGMMDGTFLKRKHRLSPSSFFGLYNWESSPLKKIINFILPLSGRYNTFLRFIKNYEEVCLKKDKMTSLFVVLFKNDQDKDSWNKTFEYIEILKRGYPNSVMKVVPVYEEFSRAIALEIGASQSIDDDLNILFFIDVDMVFHESSLERIRLNTIRGQQAYFPIVFSEFDPTIAYGNEEISESPNHFFINSNSGYWRQFGFGIASMYNADLKMVGGFNTTIKGWGKEDVDVYDKFINFSSNITIFRAADPTLIHVFHLVECSPKLEELQLKMCKGTRKDTYGSVDQLANFIYNNPLMFEKAVMEKQNINK